jgi:hypothetical protein
MNRSLAAASGTSIDRSALMSELLNGTLFFGATGLVGFDDNGDRNIGVGYDVYNNVGQGQGMALLGRWLTGNTWSSNPTPTPTPTPIPLSLPHPYPYTPIPLYP